MTEIKGQIVTLDFEDGGRPAECGLDECECPSHVSGPRLPGTYVTVRLDEEYGPIGLWRVGLHVEPPREEVEEVGAPDLSEYPEVQHRIEDGAFVCPGDENARCHRYPGCDGEHESWPCGCEYVAHAECWMKPWIDASYLRDSHADGVDGVDHISDAEFPDGDVMAWWEDEYVLWAYTDQDEAEGAKA